MLLYYITDRRQLRGSEAEQRLALLNKVSEAARNGVDYIQLREKDLSARELLQLARQAREKISEVAGSGLGTRLLVNSRIDVALASGADGVHLRGDDIFAADARALWTKAAGNTITTQLKNGRGKPENVPQGLKPKSVAASSGTAEAVPYPKAIFESSPKDFLVACSCHNADEVRRAESEGADFVVFAPVFEKGGTKGVGLQALRAACRGTPKASGPEASPVVRIPVLALGGVTLENASACMEAGAAGIAGIRLFQENDVAEVVKKLLAFSS